MRRREFLGTAVGAAAWPLAIRAQERERVRRVAMLLPATADDPVFQARVGAFFQGLQEAGWLIGRNARIDIRWATTRTDEVRRHAAELALLAPDVILSHGTSTLAPMLLATQSIPVVFVNVADPVGAGFVASLARPGGNATGFMTFEYGMGGKWLEVLKQIAPSIKRVAVLRDTSQGSGTSQFAAIQAVAPSLGIEAIPINSMIGNEIERAIAEFARVPNGSMIITASGSTIANRDVIAALAVRHKLPAVYFDRLFVVAGGLASYGSNQSEQYRSAASYVDRVLKGEKPADLPVQAPTKYELVISLKTAKALGLNLPATLLARADEVIE